MHTIPRDLLLESERCLLGFPGLELAPEILAQVTSPEFPKLLPLASDNTLHAVRTRLRSMHSAWDAGYSFCFAIRRKSAVGHLGLVTFANSPESRTWSIGYMIAPSEWGKGYATECARRVVEFGFQRLCADRVWAGASKWNPSSVRVVEKLGMRHFRTSPQSYWIQGQWIATEDYEITASEWLRDHACS